MTTEAKAPALKADSDTQKSTQNKAGANDIASLQHFFVDALKDILWAEKAIVKGLQKMQQSATNESLVEAFEDHEWQTQKHITRIEKVFKLLKEEPESKKCPAMEGLLKEADEIIASTPEGSATRDATLIIAAQKIEHYEIATYGGLVQIALTLGLEKEASLLERNLEEEENTDQNLTDIAEYYINFEAAAEEEADD